MEIQYCGGCGFLLREGDFVKGKARFLDNRPYCSECRPPEPVPLPPPAGAGKRAGSSARLPRITASAVRAPGRAPASSRGLQVGLALAGAALLLLLVFAFSGRPSAAPAAPALREDTRRAAQPPPAPRLDEAMEVRLAELEGKVGRTPDPDGILQACDELRPKLRNTPLAARLQHVEERAQIAKRERNLRAQVDFALEEVRNMEASDATGRRAADVRRLLTATAALAGERRAEVEAALAAYEKRLAAGPALGREGPFEPDADGYVRHWLLLGIFPNPEHQGFDRDYLGGEGKAAPKARDRVSFEGVPREWKSILFSESLANLMLANLGIPNGNTPVVTYAFCLLEFAEDFEGELRLGSDDGNVVWLEGAEIGRVHQHRATKTDEDRYSVKIPKGFHRLLLKVEQGDGDYSFILRFMRGDGQPARGLRIWR